MDNKKRIAAAVSAVISYLKEEHEGSTAPGRSFSRSGPWGLSGRHALMQQRSLMHQKAFHAVRTG